MFQGTVRKRSQELYHFRKGLLTQGPGKALKPQASFPSVASTKPRVYGQRHGGQTEAGALWRLQVSWPRFREHKRQGPPLVPPVTAGAAPHGTVAGASREDGRAGRRAAGRAGEAEGELTFCAPKKAWQ